MNSFELLLPSSGGPQTPGARPGSERAPAGAAADGGNGAPASDFAELVLGAVPVEGDSQTLTAAMPPVSGLQDIGAEFADPGEAAQDPGWIAGAPVALPGYPIAPDAEAAAQAIDLPGQAAMAAAVGTGGTGSAVDQSAFGLRAPASSGGSTGAAATGQALPLSGSALPLAPADDGVPTQAQAQLHAQTQTQTQTQAQQAGPAVEAQSVEPAVVPGAASLLDEAPGSSRPGRGLQKSAALEALLQPAGNVSAMPSQSGAPTAGTASPVEARGLGGFLASWPLPAPGVPGFEQAFGQRLIWMASHGVQDALVRVHPEHLGPIDIHIRVDGDQAELALASSQGSSREALELALPRLREQFSDAGLQLVRAEVSGQDSQQGGGRGADVPLREPDSRRDGDLDADPVPRLEAPPRAAERAGLLDLFA